MNTLNDIITYIRRIIKSPSDSSISNDLLIDYINRFYISDVDARVQLFDLKTTYNFQTTPGIDKYNMPLYSLQTEPGNQNIASFPVYQGFIQPCFVNGFQVPFYTERQTFYNVWPKYTQQLITVGVGTGTNDPYVLNLPAFPCIPGHVDMTGIIATGSTQDPPLVASGASSVFLTSIPTTSVYSCVYFTATDANGQNIVVADSGQFLSDSGNGDLYGLLMEPGTAPFGNQALPTLPSNNGYSITANTVNYNTGVAIVNFPEVIPSGNPINVQCLFYNQGMPRGVLFYNNTLTIVPPPNTQYNVELGAYLSPAAFLSTGSAIPFGYMAEYIARGAARKILSDTGDVEQFMFYEPLFKEQEILVWKRSQRQFTSTRTATIYKNDVNQGSLNSYGNIG